MKRVTLAMTLLGMGCFASPAEAQDGHPDGHHFEAGVRLFGRGQYREALREFEASRAERETASVVLNIASCLDALGRSAEAFDAYQRSLELSTEGLAHLRRQATRAMEALRPRIAELAVRTNVPEAEIIVNGRPVNRQPLIVDLDTDLVVEARREGYRSARVTTRASAAGPIMVELELEPPPGPRRHPRLTVVQPEAGLTSAAAPTVSVEPPVDPPRSSASGSGTLAWILVGAGAAAVGAAILVWVLASKPLEGDWVIEQQ